MHSHIQNNHSKTHQINKELLFSCDLRSLSLKKRFKMSIILRSMYLVVHKTIGGQNYETVFIIYQSKSKKLIRS